MVLPLLIDNSITRLNNSKRMGQPRWEKNHWIVFRFRLTGCLTAEMHFNWREWSDCCCLRCCCRCWCECERGLCVERLLFISFDNEWSAFVLFGVFATPKTVINQISPYFSRLCSAPLNFFSILFLYLSVRLGWIYESYPVFASLAVPFLARWLSTSTDTIRILCVVLCVRVCFDSDHCFRLCWHNVCDATWQNKRWNMNKWTW